MNHRPGLPGFVFQVRKRAQMNNSDIVGNNSWVCWVNLRDEDGKLSSITKFRYNNKKSPKAFIDRSNSKAVTHPRLYEIGN